MSFQYKLHPSAQKEDRAFVSWYLERILDAVENFVRTVDKGLAEVCKYPARYRNRYRNYREVKVRKFPFTIVYVVQE